MLVRRSLPVHTLSSIYVLCCVSVYIHVIDVYCICSLLVNECVGPTLGTFHLPHPHVSSGHSTQIFFSIDGPSGKDVGTVCTPVKCQSKNQKAHINGTLKKFQSEAEFKFSGFPFGHTVSDNNSKRKKFGY